LSKLFKGVGILAVLVVLLVVGVFVWINPIVKNAINMGGPMMLGVPVSVGDVSISPLSGVIDLKKIYVGNPDNYSTNRALFAVDRIHVSIDMKSLTKDVISIRKILIDSPQISYEVKKGKSNFDVLVENLGESEKKQKDKKDKDKAEKKVIIDEFQLNSAHVSYTGPYSLDKPVTIPFPSLELHDIGKAEGGVSAAQATLDILRSFISDFGRMLIDLGKALGDAAASGVQAIGDGAKAIGGAVGGAVGKGAKAVGDAAEKGVKAIKKLF